MHHAKGVLAAIQLRPAPFHTAIRCAFEEIEAVGLRKTLEIIKSEDQLAINKTVNHQTVVGWYDLGNTSMMPLETQSVRRHKPLKFMKRGEVH